ncbi:hypothetical protein DFH06DRAFT_1432347 [Mycena polygramma]|nr:hypothetical protein DFH06DRAFT_1432347 [Mycena polygramma]
MAASALALAWMWDERLRAHPLNWAIGTRASSEIWAWDVVPTDLRGELVLRRPIVDPIWIPPPPPSICYISLFYRILPNYLFTFTFPALQPRVQERRVLDVLEGEYKPGTPRAGSPFFEAFVGFVMRPDISDAKRAASKEKGEDNGLYAHYMRGLECAPNLKAMLDNAELICKDDGDAAGTGKEEVKVEMRTVSDYSYHADTYAGPHHRIVGDAGTFIDPYLSSPLFGRAPGDFERAVGSGDDLHIDARGAERGGCDSVPKCQGRYLVYEICVFVFLPLLSMHGTRMLTLLQICVHHPQRYSVHDPPPSKSLSLSQTGGVTLRLEREDSFQVPTILVRLLYDEFMSRAHTHDTLQSGVYQKITHILMQLRKIKELLLRRRFPNDDKETGKTATYAWGSTLPYIQAAATSTKKTEATVHAARVQLDRRLHRDETG